MCTAGAENEDRMSRIHSWLKDVLQTDEVPPFEVNDDTVGILHQIMTHHNEKMMRQKVLREQMQQETTEYIAEKERINSVLTSLDLDPNRDLSSNSAIYMKTLNKSALELETARPTLTGLAVALTEFESNFDKSKRDLETLEHSYESLMEGFNETKDLKTRFEKQYEELEGQLSMEQKNVESLRKSMKFHIHKKKDYEKNILECGEKLKACGFSNHLSHDELVKLGEQAHAVDDRLKPFRLQLESYKSLPADLNLARLKLHETLDELRGIEEELHEMFQNISLNE